MTIAFKRMPVRGECCEACPEGTAKLGQRVEIEAIEGDSKDGGHCYCSNYTKYMRIGRERETPLDQRKDAMSSGRHPVVSDQKA